MTTTTNELGQQNVFAKETPYELMEVNETHYERAEIANGRWAMIGFWLAVGTYATTGQIIPGVF